jgi:hypothetical protein
MKSAFNEVYVVGRMVLQESTLAVQTGQQLS